MNIIINGFFEKGHIPIVQKLFSEIDINSYVITYHTQKLDFLAAEKGVFVNWRKVHFFADYDVDFNNLEPLDEELIDSMRGCEAVFLKMVDRLETLKNYPYSERKDLYLKHLRFWNDVIINKKIDLFLTQNVPHETSDFVCYCLCKLKHVPTIILFQTHIPDTSMIVDDWEFTDYGLKSEYHKLLDKFGKTEINNIALSPRFEKYYHLQTSRDQNIAPFYMQNKPMLQEVKSKIISVSTKLKSEPMHYSRQWSIIARALLRRYLIAFRTQILMRYYESRCTGFSKNNPYIFVALHFQPELSTSPRADAYVDQLLIIQLLSACAPKGVKILVKEHPKQTAFGRTKKFYQDILSLPNVDLISRQVNSKQLVNGALAIATCVGLAGFEALFKDKPVLMFGHDFYQQSPGVFAIRTKIDLEKALNVIMRGPTFTPKEFKIFIKALDNISVYGTIDMDYLPTSMLSEVENTNSIVQAITNQIKKLNV